jgi:hypothetical protein
LLGLHPFLAVNAPVQADTVVVEGWVPTYVLDSAVVEIVRGKYKHVFVSGMEEIKGEVGPAHVVRYLVAAGIDPTIIVAVPAPRVEWNRTSRMARAVRDRMLELGLKPQGVNVITLGPHGRQSRLAYSRILGAAVPVGVISVPKDDYDPSYWWLSGAGIKKTTKDFAGWLRELVLGLAS